MQEARFDSKTVPKNVSLSDLLRPRKVLLNPENQQKWEKEKEANEYMNRMYGDDEQVDSNIPKEIQETLDLALGNSTVEMPKIIPFHKITYRFHFGKPEGHDIEVIFNDSALEPKTRHINRDELELLREITDSFDTKQKKVAASHVSVESKKVDNVKTTEDKEEDTDSDIFEDAGADYVFEPRAKTSHSMDHSMRYFKDEEIAEEKDIAVDIPEKSGLEVILEKSRKMKEELLEHDVADKEKSKRKDKASDSCSSDSENSIHMLEDVVEDDGVNYDYEYFYSDDEEGDKKAKPNAQDFGSRVNQDFQKMSKVYQSKFGESLEEEGKPFSSSKKRKGSDKESSSLKNKQSKKK